MSFVTIRLRYHTWFGQELFLCSDHEWFGAGRSPVALPMRFVNDELWETAIALPCRNRSGETASYYFQLRNPNGSVVDDFGNDRSLDLSNLPPGHTIIFDSWNDLGTVENAYATEPFKKVLLRSGKDGFPNDQKAPASHLLSVKAPWLPHDQTICLLGASRALGDWNQDSPILLGRDAKAGCFRLALDLTGERAPLQYKYGVFDLARNSFVRFEDGPDRTLTESAIPGGRVVMNDGFARLPARRWRGAGVAIPVFGLRSERSFGVGDFLDLRLLADWAERAGLKLIQILPVNDTTANHTWTDSYPYAAISVFALHPLYLNLDRMAGKEHSALIESLASERKQLQTLDKVEYERVMNSKLAFARQIFALERAKTLKTPAFQKFFANSKHWLEPYAAFCYLRDKFRTADFSHWPKHQAYKPELIETIAADDSAAREEMDFHRFVQFHLHLQLREAVDYLHDKGLILKGDVAIGVHPHAADVWQHPGLFHRNMQAGAPPDAFAAKGQNWGFPTYNWPRMKEDGFAWWRQRVEQMGFYFDAFRIDHVLGFFRIWSIPRDAVEGILGYFVPALPLQASDFAARGLAFDRERFVRPFITNVVLKDIFGKDAENIRRDYLDATTPGRYSLKPQFLTQLAVERHFTTLPKSEGTRRLMEDLFDLISNVILIETSGGELHFRLGMEQTSSFRHLDAATQARLHDLYLDYFFRRQDELWKREALQKLPALKRATNMLICGEDLGMVPACVPDVMRQLGILSLEIQRMPKALGADYSRPTDAPYLSVVTPATHDMSTIRGWWSEDRANTQRFFNKELHHDGSAPSECEPRIVREIISEHLTSPAMWSIFQLQDLMGMDKSLRRTNTDAERINVPAIVNHNWRFRMHVTLEELARADAFTQSVSEMVRSSGR